MTNIEPKLNKLNKILIVLQNLKNLPGTLLSQLCPTMTMTTNHYSVYFPCVVCLPAHKKVHMGKWLP